MLVRLWLGLLRALTKILLLEDDALFADSLCDLLEESDYEVQHFLNGQDALNAVFKEKFHLYLLDINVPLIDGVSLLKELRSAEDNTPAIFLTSHKDKEMIQRGFVSGGDDFLTKPFDNDELLWRITALLKRCTQNEPEVVGQLRHDKLHKTIFYKEELLELSKKEYDLLLLFMHHANESVPKELIIDTLWSSSEGGSEGAIRVYVNRLKQLLPELHIENIRAIGYKLVC